MELSSFENGKETAPTEDNSLDMDIPEPKSEDDSAQDEL